MRGWLEDLLAGFPPEQIATFLVLATSKRTISATRQGDAERDAIRVVFHVDAVLAAKARSFRTPVTGSTCSRLLWVPWREGDDFKSFRANVMRTLEHEQKQAAMDVGGAAMDYE